MPRKFSVLLREKFQAMRDIIHSFGDQNHLHGIATVPEKSSKSTGIVLLNAGSVHKVGPFDLNRDLSRFLANEGYQVLRFDFGGLGDSRKIKSSGSQRELVLSEMKAALDLFEERYGKRKVVSIGLCTGADNGFRIAIADDRVIGNVWLDGYGYSNLKGALQRYRLKLGDLSGMWYRIKDKLTNDSDVSSVLFGEGEWQWELPDKKDLRRDLTFLHERGVKILSIYSGGVASYNSYRDQFRDTFYGEEFLDSMNFEYYPMADHTYKIKKDRDRMFIRIRDWLHNKAMDS